MLSIDVLTLFPGMFEGVLSESMLKRAQQFKKVKIKVHDLRRWSKDKHKKVDDKPYGGGPGMVMKCQPVFDALKDITRGKRRKSARVVFLTPQGKTLNQAMAKKLSKKKRLVLLCGHYEGVDQRVRDALVDEEVSIGDYVLTGGELPAMVLIDAIVRLLPGVLGQKKSLEFESFSHGLLEYPQYTRPRAFNGMEVPGILLSGSHTDIEQWRQSQAVKKTGSIRKDLLPRKVGY